MQTNSINSEALHPDVKKFSENLSFEKFFQSENLAVFLRLAAYLIVFVWITNWLVEEQITKIIIQVAAPICYMAYLLLSFLRYENTQLLYALDASAKQTQQEAENTETARREATQWQQDFSRAQQELQHKKTVLEKMQQKTNAVEQGSSTLTSLLQEAKAEIDRAKADVNKYRGMLDEAAAEKQQVQLLLEESSAELERLQVSVQKSKAGSQRAYNELKARYEVLSEELEALK